MLKCGPYSKDCLIVLRNVSFQHFCFIPETLFRTLLHPHAGPLSQKLYQQQNGYHSERTERTQVTLVFHSAEIPLQ